MSKCNIPHLYKLIIYTFIYLFLIIYIFIIHLFIKIIYFDINYVKTISGKLVKFFNKHLQIQFYKKNEL